MHAGGGRDGGRDSVSGGGGDTHADERKGTLESDWLEMIAGSGATAAVAGVLL